MKAVVLAGGEGTRLRPITQTRPKPLVPIAGRYCIDYVLDSLASAQFREVIITTSYMSDYLIKTIADGKEFKSSILYSFEDTPVGTAGAVKRVAAFLDETFVVASGDVLADVDIKQLYEYHKNKGALATMALTEVENPREFGIVGIDDDNRITRFKEKPKTAAEIFSNLINAGIYILEPEVLEFIPEQTKYDWSKQVFPAVLEAGEPLFGAPIEGLWMDIGRPADLLRANKRVAARRARAHGAPPQPDGVTIDGNLELGKYVTIEPGCVIRGDCSIGDHSVIASNTTLEDVYLGQGTTVARECTMHNCLTMAEAKIGLGCAVSDSILGAESRIGAKSRVENAVLGDRVYVEVESVVEDRSVDRNTVWSDGQPVYLDRP